MQQPAKIYRQRIAEFINNGAHYAIEQDRTDAADSAHDADRRRDNRWRNQLSHNDGSERQPGRTHEINPGHDD